MPVGGRIMSKIDHQIIECKNHIWPYIKKEECTKELREMCKNCEMYCGLDHDYELCEGQKCFRFWLGYEYLKWTNSFS